MTLSLGASWRTLVRYFWFVALLSAFLVACSVIPKFFGLEKSVADKIEQVLVWIAGAEGIRKLIKKPEALLKFSQRKAMRTTSMLILIPTVLLYIDTTAQFEIRPKDARMTADGYECIPKESVNECTVHFGSELKVYDDRYKKAPPTTSTVTVLDLWAAKIRRVNFRRMEYPIQVFVQGAWPPFDVSLQRDDGLIKKMHFDIPEPKQIRDVPIGTYNLTSTALCDGKVLFEFRVPDCGLTLKFPYRCDLSMCPIEP